MVCYLILAAVIGLDSMVSRLPAVVGTLPVEAGCGSPDDP